MDKMKGNHPKNTNGSVPAKMPGAAPSNNQITAEKTKVTLDQKNPAKGTHNNGDFSQ